MSDWHELVVLHKRMDKEEKALGCVVLHPASDWFIFEKLEDPQTRWWVAEHDEMIEAFAYGTLNGTNLELQNVFVHPTWRHHGVAREMLSRLFAERRVKSATAFVLKGNIYMSFWTTLGFRAIRELVNAYEMKLDFATQRRNVRQGLKLRFPESDSRLVEHARNPAIGSLR